MDGKPAAGERIVWNWRQYFTQSAISLGEQDERNGKVRDFYASPDGVSAKGITENGFVVQIHRIPVEYEDLATYPKWNSLKTGWGARGRNAFSNYYECSCSQGQIGVRCRHLVSVLYHWEKEHGPFVIQEDPEKRKARLEREEQERIRAEKEAKTRDAVGFLRAHGKPDPEENTFSLGRVLDDMTLTTNAYETEMAERLLESGEATPLSLDLRYEGGEQTLILQGEVAGERPGAWLTRTQLRKLKCTCGRARFESRNAFGYMRWRDQNPQKLCAHQLVFLARARERIARENPGDSTDLSAARLLELLSRQEEQEKTAETEAVEIRPPKRAEVTLSPRLVRENGYAESWRLGFDVSLRGEKEYAVRKIEDLMDAADKEQKYPLGKSGEIDFAAQTFTEESLPWAEMLQGRVEAMRRLNREMQSRSGYSYGYLYSLGNGIEMDRAEWDALYDLAEGRWILCQWGARKDAFRIPVGPAHPRAEVVLLATPATGTPQAIEIKGIMPHFQKGLIAQYVLNRDGFGRVNPEEMRDLEAFRAIADPDGEFSCTVGKRKFAEFYYRVLPRLEASEQILLQNNLGNRIAPLLPAEAEFTFFVDLDEAITCRVEAAYGEKTHVLLPEEILSADAQRDREQENRVIRAVQKYFPEHHREKQVFLADSGEETLVRILTEGVESLSRYGTVKGSEAFRRIQFRPAPQPKVSIELEGGLLELSIQTKDMTESELLELLGSYRLRKRWHRLRSGDFVDLVGAAPALAELEETAQAMDLSVEELLRGEVRLPKYRALYLDRLLEKHEELAANRDRHYKALIRSFQTIRDSDFEPPESLADVLRPYQLYGFRWLSTLAAAGFGGILADEMGLGKTVQMLAFLQAEKDRGEKRPALVVCPASLVYNWREECRKFTPGLRAEPIAGGLAARRKQLQAIGNGADADLYITSYDLLKRDVELYDGKMFSTVVLDEAQYVKNQKAQASRSVRALRAEHRFALTGTPIENRLSELWSIFDFLMPGFLYSSGEFSERYELPIMKHKDEAAAEKLSRMTSPFILRRKKTDVLRDLPEKMEEVRSAAMGTDQRRLYDAQVVRMKELLSSSGDSGEDKMRILAEITRLRQLCCDPSLLFEDYRGSSAKREACLELIQSAIDGGHRMLVFSQFTSMLSLLAADLKQAGIAFYTITGATPKEERLSLVNAFNGGDVPVFLVSLKAGGTGLNLVGADVVIHYDPWWNLAVQNQATDRAHRIGQTRQVTVMKLIAADSIEEKIVELQEAKRDLAEAIISGENSSLMSLSKEELLALIEP